MKNEIVAIERYRARSGIIMETVIYNDNSICNNQEEFDIHEMETMIMDIDDLYKGE